ncbi:phosphodiesterase [Paracoccus sp. 11-3]|uniref:Phosphodiesterase n=1 Tax=Paracoccus amoyensis TaxID=2760093 RepID=A0A926JE78_9RHOB|nr:glycerophosphodiester phosphodiesterase family protein [Paracoccus amoyensis]MBC9247913.1 phosphodiesterase [Paracoccus amoyensis]
MPALPEIFVSTPIAHRGLHGPGKPENSLAAAQAAIDAGYAIEMDIQPAADGTPMVFHDYDLKRLTGDQGMIRAFDPEALANMRLLNADATVPTLAQMLELVAGRAPLLIEIKDQDGRLGPNIGDLQDRVAAELKDYEGPVAVMSFNPHAVEAFHHIAPTIPVGLTTCAFPVEDWPLLGDDQRTDLAAINAFDRSGASFISHDKDDLLNPRVDAIKAMGHPILCWTILSPEEETAARKIADNITFEHYDAVR